MSRPYNLSEAGRAKLRAIQIARWADPVYRAKHTGPMPWRQWPRGPQKVLPTDYAEYRRYIKLRNALGPKAAREAFGIPL